MTEDMFGNDLTKTDSFGTPRENDQGQTFVLDLLGGSEVIGPDLAFVWMGLKEAQQMMDRFCMLDQGADVQSQLKELIYATAMVTWTGYEDLDEVDLERDIVSGKPFWDAMEEEKCAVMRGGVSVKMDPHVEVERLHVKSTSIYWSVYTGKKSLSVETWDIPRHWIRAIAMEDADNLLFQEDDSE